MSLSLWRHEEVGTVPLPRNKQDVRYGRRQNALLLTPPQANRATNGKLLNGAADWTLTGAGSKASTADLLPPFGYQSLRLVRTDTGTANIFLERTFTMGAVINGVRKGSFTVWVNAPVGTQIPFQIFTPAAGASLAQTISLTQTVAKEGWNRMGFVWTLASTEATTLTIKFGITGEYKGPVYFNGAHFNWDVPRLYAYIDEDYGGIVNGSGYYESLGTDVTFDVPGDLMRPAGSISFWYQRVDGTLNGSFDTIFDLRDAGGTNRILYVDIANSFTATDQVRAIIGTQEIRWDVQGLTGVDEWNHYTLTWNIYGKWSLYIDGAQQPLNLTYAAVREVVKRVPALLRVGKDHSSAVYGNGLLEGLTFYDREFTPTEVRAIFKAGDNLQTGAIAHLGLWSGQPLLELGEAIGFMDTGDYRVQAGGYVPGSASAMPTVRYEQNRQGVGPYIVAERVPNVVETITFAIGRDQQKNVSASAKFAKLKELVGRSATQQRLCLNYSPMRAKRNVRAYVNYASVTPGPGWTGVQQVIDQMADVRVDLERESEFSDPVHRLGTMVVTWNSPILIPDVTGSSPASMGISTEQTPGNFYLGLRRLKLPKTPIYVLGSASIFDWTASMTTVTLAGREGGNHVRWPHTAYASQPDGKLGEWTVAQIADRANFGNYRVIAVMKTSVAVDVTAWVRIGDSIVTGRPTTSWQAIDMGNINIPGKNVRLPGLHESGNQVVKFGIYNNSGGVVHNMDLDAVFLIPVDDGYAQVLRNSNLMPFPTLLDGETGDITANLLLNGYVGGLSLSPTVPTELRVLQLSHSLSGTDAIYDYSTQPSTSLFIEYVPKWSGLGDVP